MEEQKKRAKVGELPSQMFQATFRPEHGVLRSARDQKQCQNVKQRVQEAERQNEPGSGAGTISDEWVKFYNSFTFIFWQNILPSNIQR